MLCFELTGLITSYSVYQLLLEFQPQILRFKHSDWFTQSRLAAHTPIEF